MSIAQNNAPQPLRVPPDVVERLRARRPGYDRIFDLVRQYEELPADKRDSMNEDDLLDLFARPMFEALGWSVETATPLPFKLGEFPQLRPLILAHYDLRIVVGVRQPGRLLSSERDADYQLSQWAASIDIAFGILTNFETIRIWDFSDPTPNLILESGPRQYLTDESSEVDLLAAEIFYQRLARRPEPAQKGEFIPPAEQMQQEPIQTPVDEDIKEPSPASKEFPPWGFKEEPQSNLMKPYGEPGGPQQRFEEIMAGISFGSVGIPPRTITALVTDRQSGQMLLLLAGGALPEGAEVIQPAPQQGGNTEDKIGVVIREVFNERGLGAVARPEGERPFLSILPNQRAIGGVATPREWPPVFKFGGGSDYTQGQISQVNARVELTDDFERKIMLPDAFVVEGPDFSGPGDVGALVLTGEFLAQSSGPGDNSPVTFAAGPPQAVGVIVGHQDGNTVCLPIQPILDQLGVDLIQEPVRYLRLRQTAAELTAANDLVGGEDRLGFSHYIDAFVRLIKDKNTLPPLTIGIYGAWGSGKSFLMDKIAAALYPNQDGTSANRLKKIWRRLRPSPRLWQSDTLVVRFEAWDYNAADKLWAGLVEQIFKTLETELGWYGLLRFNLKRNLQRQWRALRAKLLPYSLIAIVIGALVVGFLLTGQGRWAVAVGGTTTIILLARQLFDLFSTSASQRIVDLFAGADYKQDIGFMGRIRADLEDFTANLPDRPDYKMKVVVFIDDLDRCDPKKAVEVLEAIKLLLELDRFIVFLALDARIITQAVEQHYGKVLTEAEITGYEYLDKIVQIPFSIPEPPPRDLRNYLGSLVGLNQAEIPPLELPAARKEPPQPAEFVAEAIEPNREETESPAIASAPVNHDAAATESPETPQPAEQTQVVQELPPNAIPPLTDVPFETIEVIFGPDEQQTFLDFHAHLDANPRRLKRLVNIYKLVRALIAVQQSEAAASSPAPNHRHILGWLVVCEQWPYAAHVMLEIMAESYKRAEANPPARRALEITLLTELQQAAQQRIAAEENQTLQKLDLKYDRLESFIRQHLHDFTLADLQRLKPFTVNFNPALSAEVRLTLSKAG